MEAVRWEGVTQHAPTPYHLRLLNRYLKGLCHEINTFLKVLRIKSVLSVHALIVLKKFAALLWRTDKVLACFYESNDSIFKTLKKLIS
jgi:hypothetical protein